MMVILRTTYNKIIINLPQIIKMIFYLISTTNGTITMI